MNRVLVTDVTLTRTDHVTIGEEHGRPHDRRKGFRLEATLCGACDHKRSDPASSGVWIRYLW